jgi:TolA-binding protein
VSDQAAVYTTTGARLALAHAQVELRPQSEASWDALARTLRLQRGSVLIEVDPTQQRSFSVETASFTVHVLGTRFVVTERGVYVERGRVSVQLKASDHEHTPMILAAGSEQARFELPPIEKVDAATETAASAPPEPRTPQPVPRPSATDATLDPNVLLEQARAQLAARELTQARRTLGRAAPKLNKATQRAEALSLEAECNLLEGRFSAASDSYLRVAKRYADLPAAETALFAAARIEDEHGQPPRARALLDQYLARYPKGSYVREVEHRLQSLARRAPAEPSQ